MANPPNRRRQRFSGPPPLVPPYKPPMPSAEFFANPPPEFTAPSPKPPPAAHGSLPPGSGGLVQFLPQQMFQERPSLMVERLTAVSDMIDLYDAEARRVLEKTGVHGEPVLVTEPAKETWLVVLQVLAQSTESFQLTRGPQGWGIYHIEVPSVLVMSQGVTRTTKHIRACSIETKRLFLRNARRIFTAYAKQIGPMFEGIDRELADAAQLLNELRQIP